MKNLIDNDEQELAAKYFALSNTAMLETCLRSDNDLHMAYNRAEDMMVNECGASLGPELREWKNNIQNGDKYCFEAWNEVRLDFVK